MSLVLSRTNTSFCKSDFLAKISFKLYSHSENSSNSRSFTSSLNTNRLFLPSFDCYLSALNSSSLTIIPAWSNTWKSNDSSHMFFVFNFCIPPATLKSSITLSIYFDKLLPICITLEFNSFWVRVDIIVTSISFTLNSIYC